MNKYNIPVITNPFDVIKNTQGIRKGKLSINNTGYYYYRYIRESDNAENLNMVIYGIQLVIKPPYT